MPRSFNNGSWTSELAERMARGLKIVVRLEILKFLHARGDHGATDQELEFALKRPGNTLRPGRVGLVKDGLVQDSGQWRFTVSNRPATVWTLSKKS